MEWITPWPPCSPSRSPLSSEALQCCFTFASVSWESRSLQWDGVLKSGRRDRRVHPLHDQPGSRGGSDAGSVPSVGVESRPESGVPCRRSPLPAVYLLLVSPAVAVKRLPDLRRSHRRVDVDARRL